MLDRVARRRTSTGTAEHRSSSTIPGCDGEGEASIETHPTTRLATEAILEAYQAYAEAFGVLTGLAAVRFKNRDWTAGQQDAEARLELYATHVSRAVVRLGQLSHWQTLNPAAVHRRFGGLVASRPDVELALTFYNSVIRRFLGTVGVDPASEFLERAPSPWTEGPGLTTIAVDSETPATAIRAILGAHDLGPWRDQLEDARRIADRIQPLLGGGGQLTYLNRPLFRNRRAFLVGRLATPAEVRPLIIALVHDAQGVRAEAVVLSADEASIVFGFTRSYFHVALDHPRAAVGFLHSILPSKRIDELYTVLGYYRHGKREFYQTLQRTFRDPDTRFVPIDGVPGMVMIAFVLPAMNAVFKVIRDRSHPPKQVTRNEVLEKYRFVFLQDHGGRLADTQQFEGLALPIEAFDPAVAAELATDAQETVKAKGDHLVFSHLYTERRMVPLDVYLRQAAPEDAEAAVTDFGRAIKDLAGMNIFPGDMLAKNFGVTRHGRVVFYDYDEICPLVACNFRAIPPPRSYDDEVAAEPWFSVRDNDMFPEEFERFLRFPGELHAVFRREHRDLFEPAFWTAVQRRVADGSTVEPAPYGPTAYI